MDANDQRDYDEETANRNAYEAEYRAEVEAEAREQIPTAIPTPTQEALILYFAGTATPRIPYLRETTYEACRRNGWIVETEEWPYHKATTAGIQAIAHLL